MRSRSIYLFIILLIMALLVSACNLGDILGGEEVIDPEGIEPSEILPTVRPGEGYADVYYHFHFNNPSMKFKVDLPFAVTFGKSTADPGTFDVQGNFEDWVEMKMTAVGGPTGQCEFVCTIYAKWVAEGKVTNGPNGECQIPMQFTFTPGDWFLDHGDCPLEIMSAVDCTVMTMVIKDPSIYTFTGKKPDVTIQNINEIRLQAEIKNLTLPAGIVGTCTW